MRSLESLKELNGKKVSFEPMKNKSNVQTGVLHYVPTYLTEEAIFEHRQSIIRSPYNPLGPHLPAKSRDRDDKIMCGDTHDRTVSNKTKHGPTSSGEMCQGPSCQFSPVLSLKFDSLVIQRISWLMYKYSISEVPSPISFLFRTNITIMNTIQDVLDVFILP